ncbi:type II toxin-antitoxin system Phd/YefM family antitoxin [Desulfonatronovibrio magnus]|uniref:type II toxin-antitoxin system Phd/YefM family antitoxin n=1 Tax=Desulfonatronovibrio magnus TaxID=698827 RepID=UPI001E3A3DD8|nr:type II toxin-antitoxin system Phd/YefM family antitoxin [Desulfonatronovibrio magnus]
MSKTMTSREFNQYAGQAKKAAELEPVIITDREKPCHVLISIEEYHSLIRKEENIADLLSMPGSEDIELAIPRMEDLPQTADLK